jgi:hypothetical protein
MIPDGSLQELIDRLEATLRRLREDPGTQTQGFFLATYLRTTRAVAADIADHAFVDPDWVAQWDVAFATLYLDALDQWTATSAAPEPWRVAFSAADGHEHLPPLRHVLLGMNAHINYDLPQALLAVITDEEFDDPRLLDRRRTDHEHIDQILASRVSAEDRELRRVERPGDRTPLDRMLTPLNRSATQRFLKEARVKVWRNTLLLSQARRRGRLQARLHELETLAGQRVADLCEPGQVVFRLARNGFGVELQNNDH